MQSPLDTRLDRVEERRTAGAAEHSSAAIRRCHIWHAEAAIGTVIRNALTRACRCGAGPPPLFADEAAAALAAFSRHAGIATRRRRQSGGWRGPGSRAGRYLQGEDPGAGAGLYRRAATGLRQSLLR